MNVVLFPTATLFDVWLCTLKGEPMKGIEQTWLQRFQRCLGMFLSWAVFSTHLTRGRQSNFFQKRYYWLRMYWVGLREQMAVIGPYQRLAVATQEHLGRQRSIHADQDTSCTSQRKR